MVQTADQYEFIYKMILDSLDYKGGASIEADFGGFAADHPLYENLEPSVMTPSRSIEITAALPPVPPKKSASATVSWGL